MGMSASQARYVALTARMNDTEYEAQQVNQQRLTLSNQMNAVYEQLCNMDVPVPPSKLDPAFNKVIYKGRDGDKGYTVKSNGDGTFNSYRTVKNAPVLEARGTKEVGSSVDPTKYLSDSPVNPRAARFYKAEDFYEVVTESSTPKQTNEDKFADGKTVYVSVSYTKNEFKEKTKNAWTEEVDGNTIEHPEETYYELVSTTETKIMSRADFKTLTNNNKKIQNPSDTTVEAQEYDIISEKIDHITGNMYANNFESGKTYVSRGGSISLSGTDIINHNKTAQEMQQKEYAIADGNNYKIVTGEQLAELPGATAYVIIEGQEEKFKKAVADIKVGNGITVGGDPTMSLADAITKYGEAGEDDDVFKNALLCLEHSFPDAESDEFTVIVHTDTKTGAVSFSFCKTADLKVEIAGKGDGRTNVYACANGDYEELVDRLSGEDITFDPNTGNVVGAVIKGNQVKLTSEQVFDEDAYEDAVSDYNNDKANYDKEQNDLNHKTSIYQRQDKMLELKLTRLDSERNALNTELEAVKKVIQDAIDKGFKTFSG